MKLAALHLRSFGPFADTVLDFERSAAGLHILYGPNEAGKSSALRALNAFFFGIPVQTPDAFRHEYNALRVGAVLLDSRGARHALMRRKGNTKVLFAFDEVTGEEHPDRPLSPDVLSQLLGRVDQSLFSRLFGLSHTGLRSGGESLLAGDDDLGKAVFEAGSGVTGIRPLLGDLENAARGLFIAGGKNAAINVSLREYEEASRNFRNSSVKPRAWKELDDRARDAAKLLEELTASERSLRREEARFVRLNECRPLALQRRALLAVQAELADVVLLPVDAENRSTAARERIDSADRHIAEASARIESDRAQKAALEISRPHLDCEADIEALYHDAARARADHETLSLKRGEIGQRAASIAALLKSIAPHTSVDDAAALLPDEAQRAGLQSLCRRMRDADTTLEAHRASQAKAARRKSAAVSTLAAIPTPRNVVELEAAAHAIRQQGDLDKSAAQADARLRATQDQLARACAALGYAEPEVLAALEVPQRAQVEEIRVALQLFAVERIGLDKDEKVLHEDIDKRKTAIRGLQAGGKVVTAETMTVARDQRDRVWTAVREAYIERSIDPEAARHALKLRDSLAQAYETHVRAADNQADLLRADIARATEFSILEERVAEMQAALAEIALKKADLERRESCVRTDWTALTTGLKAQPMSPEAFGQWLDHRERALEKLAERDERAVEVRTATRLRDEARATLLGAFTTAKIERPELPALAALLAHAQAIIDEAKRHVAQIAQLERERDAAQLELDEAGQAVASVIAERARCDESALPGLATIGVPAGSGPDEIEGRLKSLDRLSAELDSLAGSRLALASAQASWDAYAERATSIAVRLGVAPPPAMDAPTFAAASRQVLAASQAAHREAGKLEAQIQLSLEGIATANASKEAACAILEALAKIASCADIESLPAAILASARKRRTEADLSNLESQLQVIAVDNVERLLEEAAAADPEALRATLAATQTGLAELAPRVREATEAAVQAKTALDQIDGASVAAASREEMEHLLAKMRSDAAQYASVKLAHVLLARAIKTYQDRTQAPLLQYASRWLSLITGGRYVRLVADYQGDHLVVLSERADGTRLRSSALSEGTADQLYLSLRLAAIEMRLGSEEPVPLILDDTLLAFDDERVGHALEALAELGKANQVILFTHHQHLLELAGKTLAPGAFAVQRLAAQV